MYDNIGGKIKTLAMVQCFIGAVISIIIGFVLIMEKAALLGLLVMVMGVVCSWILSFLIYGFGELVENTAQIARNTRPTVKGTNVPINSDQRAPLESYLSTAIDNLSQKTNK